MISNVASCINFHLHFGDSITPIPFYYLDILIHTVMKPAQEKIEKIDQRLRIQPLRGGNLLYIT